MTIIVPTIHRMMPKLVAEAVHNSMKNTQSKKNIHRLLKRKYRVNREEMHRRYEEVKALNIKHGIDPKSARARHAVFKPLWTVGNYRRSSAKVTLPKVSL